VIDVLNGFPADLPLAWTMVALTKIKTPRGRVPSDAAGTLLLRGGKNRSA